MAKRTSKPTDLNKRAAAIVGEATADVAQDPDYVIAYRPERYAQRHEPDGRVKVPGDPSARNTAG